MDHRLAVISWLRLDFVRAVTGVVYVPRGMRKALLKKRERLPAGIIEELESNRAAGF